MDEGGSGFIPFIQSLCIGKPREGGAWVEVVHSVDSTD